jgi:hypothetical protein
VVPAQQRGRRIFGARFRRGRRRAFAFSIAAAVNYNINFENPKLPPVQRLDFGFFVSKIAL